MVIIPNSTIILLKSPLKLDNYNQITFSNLTAQYNYFNSLPKLTLEDATYQRKEGVIRFPTHTDLNDGLPVYEDLLKYNYCMYQNTSYSNKWFYAFIDEINYINDGVSEIKIETDTFQSWQFDIVYMNSFIEREHVSDDTIGLHTLPEGLETGEYIIQSHVKNAALQNTEIVISSTRDFSEFAKRFGGVYNGILSGFPYYCIKKQNYQTLAEYYLEIENSIIELENAYPDSIVSIFMAPSNLVTEQSTYINESYQPVEVQQTIEAISTINGYTPKNKKLLTYPFVAINMSNGQGANAIYHQELFTKDSNGKLRFQIEECLTPGCSIRCYPIYYKGEALPYDEAVVLGKYPELNWSTDNYTNWLTQNGVNIASDVGVGLLKIIGAGSIAASTKDVTAGAIALGGATEVFNSMNSIYQHSFAADTAKGNINCGDVITANSNNTFHWYLMTIKREYAEMIDHYFDMYGYKVNSLKTPNIHKRSNWDYIKTIDVNLEGEIPEKDLDKIRNLFNNGCTFWHTTTYFLDYSKTNSILT